jgi:hypothetical protein
MMATHELKTWPEPFEAIWTGAKRAEFRKDDREPRYAVGDWLHLKEWNPHPTMFRETGFYTGRMVAARITDIRRESFFGIPAGYAMLSLGEMTRYPREDRP